MRSLAGYLGRQRVQNRYRDDDDHVDDDSGSGKPGTPGHPGLEMISTMCPPFPIQDVRVMSVWFRRYGRGGTSPTTVAMDAFRHGERRELRRFDEASCGGER